MVPISRTFTVLAGVAAFLALNCARAAADPIVVPIVITSGSGHVERDIFLLQPSGALGVRGAGGFSLSAFGPTFAGGNCDPCFSGDEVPLSVALFAHSGTVIYGSRSGEFDLFQSGGGELDLEVSSFFVLPPRATTPIVIRTPFTAHGSITLGADPLGGTLADYSFNLSGSGLI